MAKRKTISVTTLLDLLRRQRGRRTVLGVAIPILSAQIKTTQSGRAFLGVSAKEIEAGFRELCGKYIHSHFHNTYIDRRLGPRSFLMLQGDLYSFRPTLLENVSLSDLSEVHDELVASLRTAAERRQAVIRRLEVACSLPADRIVERQQIVDDYLRQFLGNGGENFEILSFAILRQYFQSFGFELRRFSTTHANDGGIDYVAGSSIYQVSSDESLSKLRSDLAKAPGTERVIVRPQMTAELLGNLDGQVLETLELNDLLTHFVGWMLSRDHRSLRAKHLQGVLQVALAEFRREERTDTTGHARATRATMPASD